MQPETTENSPPIGEMEKRRVTMADGRRYLIYYSFEPNDEVGTMNDELKSADPNSSFIVPTSSFKEDV